VGLKLPEKESGLLLKPHFKAKKMASYLHRTAQPFTLAAFLP